MRLTLKLVRYQARDVARSRWLLAYAGFFVLATDALLRFGNDGARALLSLANVVLFVVPLVGLAFGTTYLHDAREFTELLLAQPVRRSQLFAGLSLGLALPLAGALVLGVALPFVWHGLPDASARATLAVLLGCGVALTAIFVALAFLIAVRADDKVRALGAAVGVWLGMALVYDALVVVAVATFADHPVERPLLGLMLANPVDLARVLLLLRFDAGALMGYTGAVFARAFQGGAGVVVAATALTAWAAVPAALGLRAFRRKDF
jgi:Cu-processing system permease protein